MAMKSKTEICATADALLTNRLGFQVKGYVNQNSTQYRYGNAWVDLVQSNGKLTAKGRKEGTKVIAEFVNANGTEDVTDDLLDWVSDILKTGRTIEVGAGIGVRKLSSWMPTNRPCDMDYAEILESIEGTKKLRPPWNLNPEYQRGHVWTEQQSKLFLGHWLEGGFIQIIYIQRYDGNENFGEGKGDEWIDAPEEVVDGQQRLRALHAFIKGEIPAQVLDGREFWFKDTNEIDRRFLPTLKVSFFDLPYKARLNFYLRLNSGGTVHTTEELQKVRNLLTTAS